MLTTILAGVLFLAPVSKEWHRVPADKRLHLGFESSIGAVVALAVFADDAQPGDLTQHGHVIQPWETTTRFKFALAGGSCMAAGLGKEVWFDWIGPKLIGTRGTGVDLGDLAYDAIGCAAGTAAGAGVGHGLRVILTPKGVGVGGRF